ncbi:hypothetical protein, variant 1 [Verruconis gallopava]|nr:hypothetical protein, variant 1 [Verruconis gallopava]KIV99451.1 hypothetical protein, variant 1 [Verruconis gallopava]
MVLLGQYAAVKARESTKADGAPPDAYGTYNSSASVINAIFLVINTFFTNVLKAARPALYIPSIQFTIFTAIGFTFGPSQPTMEYSYSFVKELLYTFLTGQAIATGVAIFVIPVSSRKVFFAEATQLLRGFQALLKSQSEFLAIMRQYGSCADAHSQDVKSLRQRRAESLKMSLQRVISLSAKLQADVVYAQREAAYGHLKGTDIRDFYRLLRGVLVPISSLSTMTDISERLYRNRESNNVVAQSGEIHEKASGDGDILEDDKEDVDLDWQELVGSLHESFETVVQILDDAITHVLVLLKLAPVPISSSFLIRRGKSNSEDSTGNVDVEKGPRVPKPGDLKFGHYLEKEINDLRPYRTAQLQKWAGSKGVKSLMHKSAAWAQKDAVNGLGDQVLVRETRLRRQLSLVLYMEYLGYSIATTILALVQFAEAKVRDGTLSKRRLITPTYQTIKIWIKGMLFGHESKMSAEDTGHESEPGGAIRLGDALKSPRDPEHLPPKNSWQAFGDRVRSASHILGSDAAQFGVRVTIATMSVGIMAYLEKTHTFFIKQRVVWAVIMIIIGMKPTNGSANFNLACNIVFSVGGMASAYINWYVADGHTTGVIVVFAFSMAFWFYWAARCPRFLIGIVVGALTQVLIIGYELQVRVLGIAKATSTGQLYYPIYELAPYRLLLVLAGSVVAYIWTIFPVPITEASVLRQNVGRSLFVLAKYLSCVTTTVDQRIHDEEGDVSIKTSPGRRLQDMRGELLDELILLINAMQQNLVDIDWEPPFGGEFPKQAYSALVDEIQNTVQYLTVIAYCSEAFSKAHASSSTWLSTFAASRDRSRHKSHKAASLLTLLAASVAENQALPPYLTVPKAVHLSAARQVEARDDGAADDILDVTNLDEPGFRALGVIEVASARTIDGMNELAQIVKDLVGEVDFSFQIGKAKSS